MRLIGRSAASRCLNLGLADSAARGAAALICSALVFAVLVFAVLVCSALVFAAGSGPALAAAANPLGNTFAAVTPSTTTGGARVIFTVSCASPDTASATLFGTTLGLPEQIPMQAGASGGDFVAAVTLPSDLAPGTYQPNIDCSDGTSATATLRVTALPAEGGAQTGEGATSTQTNTGLSAGGLALIAVGAVAGGIALRRRSSGTSSGTSSGADTGTGTES
jgi:hypothetical protein